MNVDVRIFFSDVLQKIDIPAERQFRMMPALHQNLHTARGRKLVEFLVDLFERKNVVIFVALRPIKRAELAIHIANVRVIDVPVGDVSYDLASAAAVTFFLGQVSPHVCQRAEFLQRQRIQLDRFVG